ncbi:MAG TPA: hypothetical protein VL574_12935 [Stellaceae bacterium]|jgi:predicted protein tyrosine phosphatase|nr:hypothetical protein [Stellaceae bacterium]
MRVRILSRADVELGRAADAEAVISIRGSADGDEPELDLALAQATKGESARLLRLRFDDIGMTAIGTFVGPSIDQIQQAIDFGRRVIRGRDFFDGPVDDPLVAIHCEQGRSRSSAIALGLLADALGAGRERQAVNTLLRDDIEVRLHPNPLIVSHIDACLFRYGRLDAALVELSPRYGRWKQLWLDIQADPDAYHEKVRQALGKRSQPR